MIYPQFSPQCKAMLLIINELQIFSLHSVCGVGAGAMGGVEPGRRGDGTYGPTPRNIKNGV
jgi:hypothetical protein